jgi:chemotaxis family two-component system response regulator Rcp1
MSRVELAGAILNVLLVEDSPGDVRLTREAFQEVNSTLRLHVAVDGVDAIAFLRNEAPYAAAPRPDIILLDLNLPKRDGREVLAEIKSDDSLKRIPTIILTTSDSEQDVTRSYQLQANAYLTKPVTLEHFERLIELTNDFWLTAASLPQRTSTSELQ